MFLFNKPHFYDFILPQKFNSSHPNLTAALEGEHLLNKDLLIRQLTSLGGQKFIGFAKSAKYGKGWQIFVDYLVDPTGIEMAGKSKCLGSLWVVLIKITITIFFVVFPLSNDVANDPWMLSLGVRNFCQ